MILQNFLEKNSNKTKQQYLLYTQNLKFQIETNYFRGNEENFKQSDKVYKL